MIVSLTYLRFTQACLSQHFKYRAADGQVNLNLVPPRQQPGSIGLRYRAAMNLSHGVACSVSVAACP